VKYLLYFFISTLLLLLLLLLLFKWKNDMDGKSEHRKIRERKMLYVTTLGGDDK